MNHRGLKYTFKLYLYVFRLKKYKRMYSRYSEIRFGNILYTYVLDIIMYK